MNNLPKESLGDLVYILENQHIPFTVRRVNRSWSINSALGGNRYGSNIITRDGMNFIKRVRAYIDKNDIAQTIPVKTKEELGLKYMMFDFKRMNTSIFRVKEIDISMAYWMVAYKWQIINGEIFKEGKKFTKIERLAALGSLAKKIYERKFNGYTYGKAVLINDSSATRHIWYFISNEVDKLMGHVAKELGNAFIFYWVDAIFFEDREGASKKVKEMFEDEGYGSKMINIPEIEFSEQSVKAFSKGNGKQYDEKRQMEYREFCYSIENDSYWNVKSYKERIRNHFKSQGRLGIDKIIGK